MPDFKPFFLEKRRLTYLDSKRSFTSVVNRVNLPTSLSQTQTYLFLECCQLQTEPTKKLLMRRYATIQRARDSDEEGLHGPGWEVEAREVDEFLNFLEIECWEYEDDYLSADEAMSKERRSGRRRRRELEGRLVLDFERLLNTWRSEKSLEEVKKGKSSSNETQDGVEKNAPVHSMVTGSYKY
ncbi:hypothetical protein BY996DRAFT_6454358 [Phakopsora pachyrhizi]|nr:hypothetical protein BY996DRAFT_6454358 [Phakopsora pachyrhizi]